MRPRHELARVANVVLLELIPRDSSVSLVTLVAMLEERIDVIRCTQPEFDFVYWARGTLAEVIHFLADAGLLVLSGAMGDELRSQDSWGNVFVSRAPDAEFFIHRARAALPDLIGQLESVEFTNAASA